MLVLEVKFADFGPLMMWIVLLERRIEFSSSIRLNAAIDFLVSPDFDYFAFFGISLDPKSEIDSKKWVRFAELVCRRIALGL